MCLDGVDEVKVKEIPSARSIPQWVAEREKPNVYPFQLLLNISAQKLMDIFHHYTKYNVQTVSFVESHTPSESIAPTPPFLSPPFLGTTTRQFRALSLEEGFDLPRWTCDSLAPSFPAKLLSRPSPTLNPPASLPVSDELFSPILYYLI